MKDCRSGILINIEGLGRSLSLTNTSSERATSIILEVLVDDSIPVEELSGKVFRRAKMGEEGRICLFGDLTNDFVPGLRQLLRVRDSPLLCSFFEKTHLALRQEITQQNRNVRESLPRFSNASDLFAAYLADRTSDPVLAITLSTLYQLGSFIRYA